MLSTTTTLGNDRIKDAFAEHLTFVKQVLSFHLYTWVLMPEQFHLLILPGSSANVTAVLRRIKAPFARHVVERWRQLDANVLPRITDAQGKVRFWQPGGGYDRNITADGELEEKIDYMHANPVRRTLANRSVDWRWSSALWYAGKSVSGPTIDSIDL